mgnify:CR=1 FL=1
MSQSHIFTAKKKKKVVIGEVLPPAPTDKPIAMNPLKMFPSKSDTITKTFSALEKPQARRQLEGYERWMYPDRVDPTFGVGGSSQEDYIRRSYRRIASSNLFNPLAREDVSLKELHKPMPAPRRKFVLVEEARLEELSKFENVLREEKVKLGEQAAWLLSDTDVKACTPTPATRLAIHNVCEAEMRALAAKINTLNGEWNEHYRKNHYDRPPIFLKNSFVESAPLAQKAMQLMMVKEATQSWRQRKDRDTMLYEDDLSQLVMQYRDAQERRVDYDRYFVLATRYGHWDEATFYKDNRPGHRYWRRVMVAVRGVQRIWGSYWAVRRIRLFRGARALQTLWRKFYAYKWNYPVIKMRQKIGKRTYYAFCWQRWMEYLELCLTVKSMIRAARAKPAKMCFVAWKSIWVDAQTGRVAIMRRFVKRMQNAGLAGCYTMWVNYVNYRKNIKNKVKRWLSGYFTFDVWINYTKYRRYMRKLNNASTTLCCGYRMLVARKAYRRKRDGLRTLIRFSIICKNWVFVAVKRKRWLDRKFITWHPAELKRRISVAATNERNRGHRLQMMVQEKEKAAAQLLRRHLRGKNGKVQLKEEARAFAGLDKAGKSALQLARSDLIRRCVAATRMYESHNFDIQYPPVHVCADAGCGTIFTDDEQYHRHLHESPRHRGLHHNWSGFHMMLKNKAGCEALNTYIIEKYGFGELNHCVDLWTSIQEWKRQSTDSENYLEHFIEIYDTYLAGRQATHPVNLKEVVMPHFEKGFAGLQGSVHNAAMGAKPYGDSDIDAMLETVRERVEAVRIREFENDFYCERVAKHSILRTLTFRPAQRYEAWTDMNVVDPKLLDHVAYACFLKLFNTFGPDPCPTNMPEDLMHVPEFDELYKAQREANTISPWGEEAEARFDLCNCEGIVEWRRDRVIPIVAGDPAYAAHTFYNSPFIEGYREAQHASERNQTMNLFNDMKQTRIRDFKRWADDYKEHDTNCTKASWKAVDHCFEPLLTAVCNSFLAEEMGQEIFRRSALQQGEYEPQVAKSAEAVDWTEIDLFEEFWAFYVPTMLMSMLEVPDFRRGMLEYAGMVKLQLKKTLQIDMNKKNEGKEWFDAFFNEAADMENEVAPSLTKRGAAKRIQKLVRGFLGRRRARVFFTSTFTKRYDPTEKMCYYTNEATGETSWEPPRIIKYIWPGVRF